MNGEQVVGLVRFTCRRCNRAIVLIRPGRAVVRDITGKVVTVTATVAEDEGG